MNRNGEVARTQVVEAGSDPFIAACRDLAAKHAMWMNIGSTPVLAPDGRFLNHSAVIDATGTIRATYDKVHLFDVAIEGQPPIGESKRFAPGAAAVVLDTPWGPWGLSICYDLRFPLFLPPLRTGRRKPHLHPVRLHRAHRPRTLGGAAPRPRHRNGRLRARRRTGRPPRRRARDMGPRAGRRPLGDGAGRSGPRGTRPRGARSRPRPRGGPPAGRSPPCRRGATCRSSGSDTTARAHPLHLSENTRGSARG